MGFWNGQTTTEGMGGGAQARGPRGTTGATGAGFKLTGDGTMILKIKD